MYIYGHSNFLCELSTRTLDAYASWADQTDRFLERKQKLHSNVLLSGPRVHSSPVPRIRVTRCFREKSLNTLPTKLTQNDAKPLLHLIKCLKDYTSCYFRKLAPTKKLQVSKWQNLAQSGHPDCPRPEAWTCDFEIGLTVLPQWRRSLGLLLLNVANRFCSPAEMHLPIEIYELAGECIYECRTIKFVHKSWG
jgi:hypothetical protein